LDEGGVASQGVEP